MNPSRNCGITSPGCWARIEAHFLLPKRAQPPSLTERALLLRRKPKSQGIPENPALKAELQMETRKMIRHKYALTAGLPILILTGLSVAYGQTGSGKTSGEHRSGLPTDPYSQKVKNSSFTSPGGERVLRHELVIEASLEELWNAMTTEDGLKSFMVPTAKVELKTGGAWETNYRVGSRIGDPDNIRNQVLCYIPLEMLALKINLTAAFPEGPRNAGTLFAVMTFKQLEPTRVLLTESMAGWQQG